MSTSGTQLMDIDGNGWITGRELKMRLRQAGIESSADAILAILDINKDNKVSFDEFVDSFQKIMYTNVGMQALELLLELTNEDMAAIQPTEEEIESARWQ
eukprot:6167596-Pyramimonas_sp.AAC.1